MTATPSVTLALILELGARRELVPVHDRGLLVDAATAALLDVVDGARRETDPVEAEARRLEATLLSRVFARLLPELREALKSPPCATAASIQ